MCNNCLWKKKKIIQQKATNVWRWEYLKYTFGGVKEDFEGKIFSDSFVETLLILYIYVLQLFIALKICQIYFIKYYSSDTLKN